MSLIEKIEKQQLRKYWNGLNKQIFDMLYKEGKIYSQDFLETKVLKENILKSSGIPRKYLCQ